MEVYVVNITNIPGVFNENIEIRQVTAEETLKKEEFSDGESFKIESDMQEEIIPREEKREVMPIDENDPEKCIFTEEKLQRKRKNVEGKSSGRKKRIPFSCCHCEFIGNNATELRKHKRDTDS